MQDTKSRLLQQLSPGQGHSEGIIDTLLSLIPKDRRYHLVLDGLEDVEDEEVKDILISLERMMQSRIVLLCCSCRTGARFQRIALTHLRSDHLIPLNDQSHNDEIKEFINKEVERRNSSRHLKPELEALVKKQLIAGSRGMYLWVSLQLDTIFPTYDTVVTTDEDTLNIITNLPKDLPEAFERALDRVIDKRYGDKILKLTAAAIDPLNIDELRVALTITPGEPVWHPTMLPQDGSQLVSLCGGNLLELDEEDNKVRFIHQSVLVYLVSSTSEHPGPSSYHFSLEDADFFMGLLCVTYLSFPIFDTRMTIQRKIRSSEVADKVAAAAASDHSLVDRLARYLLSKKQSDTSYDFDIGRVASELQAYALQHEELSKCFLPYAASNWLVHTRAFEEDKAIDVWLLWQRLVEDELTHVNVPFLAPRKDPISALHWAISNSHGGLFLYVLTTTVLHSGHILDLLPHDSDGPLLSGTIRNIWLGDIMAQYLAFANELITAGADPSKALMFQKPAVQVALEMKRLDLLELLGQSNNAVNQPTSDGTCLLWLAARRMSDDWALLLLKLGADPNAGPFIYSNLEEDDTFDASLERYPLQVALMRDRTIVSLELIHHGAKVNPTVGPSPLDLAIEAGNRIVIAKLLELGGKGDLQTKQMSELFSPGCTALGIACKMFLDFRTPLDPELRQIGAVSSGVHGVHPLAGSVNHVGVEELINIIEVLLKDENDESINTQDLDGNTALHHVAKSGMLNLECLLRSRANPNIQNLAGESPLFAALSSLKLSSQLAMTVIPLLKGGADPNARTVNGTSLLEVASAAIKIEQEVVSLLVEAGAIRI
ncbi:hypothetical protein G7Z17_g2803 [Cylindrodendrum hubeiense]|uniref:GPI inositol-deacylase winged helix domain-containing protein n=1 Tax=Cylindrodendrum hubeiense TaxID=595255 RepID=A0A9P5HGY8_9HYPO|nr:hypothetical protein G7Z17_g2803 [Cylindrodendrum hubeiense]